MPRIDLKRTSRISDVVIIGGTAGHGASVECWAIMDLDIDFGWNDVDGADGLARLFDDVIRDWSGGGDDAGGVYEVEPIDPTTGVYGEEHFRSLVEEAISQRKLRRGATRRSGVDLADELALVGVRIADWEQLQAVLGEGGRGELVSWVARQLEEMLRLDDDLGRGRPDAFLLLVRGLAPEAVEVLARSCGERVEALAEEELADSVRVRVVTAGVRWEGERACLLFEAVWRAVGGD